MAKINYTDDQINEFLEVAQEIGIGRAQRQLGYPGSWDTANRWAKLRNVTVAVDVVKQKAYEFHDWYKTEEILIIAQEGMSRIMEDLQTQERITADDQKKLSEAFVKHYNVWANVQGKANDIKENREGTPVSDELLAMLEKERQRKATEQDLLSRAITN